MFSFQLIQNREEIAEIIIRANANHQGRLWSVAGSVAEKAAPAWFCWATGFRNSVLTDSLGFGSQLVLRFKKVIDNTPHRSVGEL